MSLYKGMKELGRDNKASLDESCRACKLDKAPMREVAVINEAAVRPDAAIDYNVIPYWLMNGIGVQRLSMRSVF